MHPILNTMFSMIFVTALAVTVLGAPVPRTPSFGISQTILAQAVTQGAVWLYDADDPTCTPTVVSAARWTTTAIRLAGSAARIDQPNPGNCPF